MKNILHRRAAKLSILLASAAAGVVLALSLTGASAAGTFGPDRTTKAWSPTVTGFDHVQFNSFTGVGNGVGNEEDFYKGLEVGRDSTWNNPVSNVDHGSEVEAKIYIHNNADASLNASGVGVAHNVTVRVALPAGLAQTQDTTAYISASNASPQTIYDTMQITGADNGYFQLAEEAGTAQLHEQDGTVINLTTAQEAAMFSPTGVNLGDQDGCFSYVQEVTFKMKVQMPKYNILKQVGLPGQSSSTLAKSITATPGETLAWAITFSNTGETPLSQVKIVDQVPAGLTVVPGTVRLINGNYPSGYTYPDSAIQAGGKQINVNIGDYNPGTAGVAYVTYHTTVAAADALSCGNNAIVNEAFATPTGLGSIEDTATANVNKQCTPVTPVTPTTPTTPVTPASTPTQLVNTGPGDVIGIFGLTTIVGAVAHRLFSRRFARS